MNETEASVRLSKAMDNTTFCEFLPCPGIIEFP